MSSNGAGMLRPSVLAGLSDDEITADNVRQRHRREIAAQVMAALVAGRSPHANNADRDLIAQLAVRMADTLLAELAKGGTP